VKIGLAGWGIETISAYHFFGPEHDYVICNEEPRDDFPKTGNIELYFIDKKRQPGLVGNVSDLSYFEPLIDCDKVVIVTPARKNLEKYFGLDHPIWNKITDAERIFFEESPTKNIVGITGTKGKGTTSTLIYKILKASGKDVYLGGNIGKTPLDFLHKLTQESWVVLELSSFQLYKFPYSPHIAVHLMMMHEHIEEWHKTMEDYVDSKRRIFLHQNKDDFAIYYPRNKFSSANVKYSEGIHVPYCESPGAFINLHNELEIEGTVICSQSEFKLLGDHNVQNICAAVSAVWQVQKDAEAVRSVVTNFSGLEHRLELAGTINGVRYYDDSFGTTPDTAIVAMDAFSEDKVMIVGGHDKGNDMSVMCQRLSKGDIVHAIFIGTIGESMRKKSLDAGLSPEKTSSKIDGNSWTMNELVKKAHSHAKPGNIVLLSTGSSSFGIFQDYKDRGNQFKDCVQKLQK
jgi:UDP-N-acetylmuramoylalanine--D-glutamate ligase